MRVPPTRLMGLTPLVMLLGVVFAAEASPVANVAYRRIDVQDSVDCVRDAGGQERFIG